LPADERKGSAFPLDGQNDFGGYAAPTEAKPPFFLVAVRKGKAFPLIGRQSRKTSDPSTVLFAGKYSQDFIH
jgi:hypothetical protein